MKTFFLFLAASMCASGAISLDGAPQNAPRKIGSGTTSTTWNHTIGVSGTNRALFVVLAGLAETSVTGVTVDGVEPMALVQDSSSSGWITQIWEMVNPPVGTHSITATWGSTPNNWDAMFASSLSFFGVNQDKPSILKSVDVTAGNATNTATVATSAASDWIIGVANAVNASTMTATTGQTELQNVKDSSGAAHIAVGYRGPVSAGSNTMTWTTDNNSPTGIAIAAIRPFVGNVTASTSGGGDRLYLPPPPPAPRPYQVSSFKVPSPSGGDTQFYTWTSSATRAGNWNGGAILGTYNDYGGFGCGSSSICLYEITAYNSSTPSWTTGLVNGMTSYLGSSDLGCYDRLHQMKSRKPFAFDGVIFLPIFCMSDGPPYSGYQSGFVVSPDGGSHWCNLKTFNQHGGNCTAAFGDPNGDNPTDASGFQWPLADGTNKMTRMQIVDFLCQDNSINCPVAPGVDPSYLYFMMAPSDGSQTYVVRVPKSIGWRGIMAGDNNWQVYNSGVWTSSVENASDISSGVPMVSCCSSWSYLKDFRVFAAWIHGGLTFATAPTPWGPWTQKANISVSGNMGFPTPIPGLCPKYNTPGSVICTVASSPFSDSLTLLEVNLGAARAALSIQ
jgi:hypothetical protein